MDLVETQGIYVTPSEIIEYLYCPRFVYFMNCLGIDQHEEQRYKVLKGREIHQERRATNIDYLRKRLGCVGKDLDVYMSSNNHHLRGKVDEVLYLSDGTLAPLDYKYADYRDTIYRTHKYQSALYAILIKETYHKEVLRGFICYVRSKNKVREVCYTENDFATAQEIVNEMLKIMQTGYFPKRTKYQIRCIDCCYRNICV